MIRPHSSLERLPLFAALLVLLLGLGFAATASPSNKGIVIDLVKLDGATIHEASGQVMWDMNVKAGDTEERKLRYVIQSPKDLMVLAD